MPTLLLAMLAAKTAMIATRITGITSGTATSTIGAYRS